MVTTTVKIVFISGVAVIVVVAVVVPLAIVFSTSSKKSPTRPGCLIYPFETDPHPLIVLAKTSQFLYPNPPGKHLKFKVRNRVDFICPGGYIHIDSMKTDKSLMTGSCLKGSLFEINKKNVDWSNMSCSTSFPRDIRPTGFDCRWRADGHQLEVGYSLLDGRFLRSLLICFNRALQIPYYTYIKQTPSIKFQVPNTPRPPWLQGTGIYSIDGTVSDLYSKMKQRSTINRLLGLPAKSTKYIKRRGRFFLARGHLTPRSDGYYAAQQNATFFMQNVAPQWQTFNGNNWKGVETAVRKYAHDYTVNLSVWTGVLGITTLPHVKTGKPTELYLLVNETSKLIPVPEIFWKIVYNPISKRGVALIGINNPYKNKYNPLCPDISQQISWLDIINRTDQVKGFCYACSLTSFMNFVSEEPELTDEGLLK